MKRTSLVSFFLSDQAITAVCIQPQKENRLAITALDTIPLRPFSIHEGILFNTTHIITLMHTWLNHINAQNNLIAIGLPDSVCLESIHIRPYPPSDKHISIQSDSTDVHTVVPLGKTKFSQLLYYKSTTTRAIIAQYELFIAQTGLNIVVLSNRTSALCMGLQLEHTLPFIESITDLNAIKRWLTARTHQLIQDRYVIKQSNTLTDDQQYILGASLGIHCQDIGL